MTKNIFAFTSMESPYPKYISVNETDDPDLFTITVRGNPVVQQGELREGSSATITLTMTQMEDIAGSIICRNTGTAV